MVGETNNKTARFVYSCLYDEFIVIYYDSSSGKMATKHCGKSLIAVNEFINGLKEAEFSQHKMLWYNK